MAVIRPAVANSVSKEAKLPMEVSGKAMKKASNIYKANFHNLKKHHELGTTEERIDFFNLKKFRPTCTIRRESLLDTTTQKVLYLNDRNNF